MEIQSLSKNLTNDRIDMPYPHVKVLEPSDALALLIPILSQGELPVICEFEGTTRKIGSIRKSALVLKDLSRVSKMIYYKNEAECFDCNDTPAILEAMS